MQQEEKAWMNSCLVHLVVGLTAVVEVRRSSELKLLVDRNMMLSELRQ